jgi:hypothetical protein
VVCKNLTHLTHIVETVSFIKTVAQGFVTTQFGTCLLNWWSHIPEDLTLLKPYTPCEELNSHLAFIHFVPDLKFLLNPVAADNVY